MAKERLKSPRARLFVALDLPDDVRAGLVDWQRTALSDPALRLVRPESLHITLVFLGYQAEKEVKKIAKKAFDVEAQAPAVELVTQPLGLPRNRPRLIALDARSDETVDLQKQVEENLVSEGYYEPEKRPFWPHLTVARVRKERRGSKRPARVERAPGALPEALCEAFRGVRITLYRSILRPQGAEYAPLAQLELPAGQTD